MKVKYFEISNNDNYEQLEDEINHFIGDKKVIDIKYQRTKGGYSHWLSVMVLYEVKKE